MMTKHLCGTCRHGEFEKTASGRVMHKAGMCLYVVRITNVPICVRVEPYKTAIWPDYANCPCWTEKEQPSDR